MQPPENREMPANIKGRIKSEQFKEKNLHLALQIKRIHLKMYSDETKIF
jgi:hypothetical protein